jgi:hypothetical protein
LDLSELIDILTFQSVLMPLGAALEQGRAARKGRCHGPLIAAAVRQLALQSVSEVEEILELAASGQCVSRAGCAGPSRRAGPAALVLQNLVSKVLMGKR